MLSLHDVYSVLCAASMISTIENWFVEQRMKGFCHHFTPYFVRTTIYHQSAKPKRYQDYHGFHILYATVKLPNLRGLYPLVSMDANTSIWGAPNRAASLLALGILSTIYVDFDWDLYTRQDHHPCLVPSFRLSVIKYTCLAVAG